MSEVRPEDSASQSGKSSTVSSSRRVRALAKSAALAAEMEALKLRQELELEEVKLKQKKAALEMQTKLKVMEAEGLVYSQFEEGSKASRSSSNVITFKASSDKTEVNDTRTEGHVFKADGGQESTLQYPRESLSKQSFKIDVPREVHVAQPPVSTPKDDSWQIKNRLDTEILRHLELGQVNQQQLLESINLPNAELMKFDGNPLKYYEFVQSFDCMVGDTMLPSSGKLMRLFNSCEGAARKVIQSCMMLMPDQGYLRARELLEERFGNSYKIGEAWMRRVTDGPAITNSSKQLREYADDLQSCTETLRALGIVQEMSSQRELVKIIERLPFHLRSRWLREVKRIRDDSRRPPNIYDVVIYVNAAAEEMSDPVYGSLIQGGSRDSRSGKTKEKTSSSTLHWQQSPKSNFSSSLNPQKCMLCDNDHVLFSCQQFKSMNPEQRLQYARDQKLCFNCLKPGHMSSKCLLNRTCSVKGCTMKHTKFLHTGKPLKFSEHKNLSMKSERVKSQSHSTTQTDDGAPFEALSSHTSSEVMGAGKYRVALPIVPVKVRAADGDTVVETFALLDSGSTNSFCVKELQDVLQTKGRSKILSVSTLEKENSQMRCQVLKLKVIGLTSDRELDVKAYTRPNLNISISNMATEVEITNSPHLRDLDLPEISRSQVTILIGQDVPEALMPLEVRAGKPGEIYAVRTVLGWTLNGPLRGKEAQDKESVHVSSSFISDTSNAGLEEQVKRFWKLEGMEYHHDDSKSNPADDLSRGLTAEELKAKQRWVHGPKFLLEGKGNWPTDPVEVRSLSECDPEVKMSKDASTFNTTADDENVLDKMIAHYSSWYKLKRAVCWMVKFLKWLKAKKRPLKLDVEGDSNRITFDEMTYAEQKIIQYEQSRFFREEIGLLTAHDDVKKSSSIYKLDPKLEGCLIRVGGRLSRSALPLEAKHPIVLPKGSSVSKLILREIHEKSGHSGRNLILSTLRERFWLPGAGAEIRKMMGRCVSCRRKRAKVMQQKMADLPKDRVTPDEPPFSRVGMDFFGPIEVKRGRIIVKRYGVIFTCLAIRAVHIEMSSSLDTDSCIDAIRRFIARRGNVKEIRSDNGTNLVGAEREMRQKIEGWNQAKVNNELLQRNIKWSFNPPGASHFGGIWERQIGTVRKLILALTKQQTLSDESLSTLLCEVESIINNRPITRLSDDANDVEALTPNHLLLLNRKPQLPPLMSDKSDVYARRRWRQVQYMADLFWRRWIKEYLPQLQEREKWVSSRPNVKVGDLVLVVNENVPRNLWQLGRVLKTMPDRRGFVRSVEVKTRNSVLVRPISKLCLILEADV